MPELPDVEAYLFALRERVLGRVLEEVRVSGSFFLRTVAPRLDSANGRRVVEVRRVGKRVAIGLEGGIWLVIHLMIAGRLHWKARGVKLGGRQMLASFDFENGSLTVTEAGSKRRASLYVVAGEAGLAGMDPGGMDVMGCSAEAFRAALAGENRTLKRALTDPRVLSGIGNAYSYEILWAGGLSPILQTKKMTDGQWEALFRATRETLGMWRDRFIAEAGLGFPEKVTAFREGMAVHGRFGKACPRCGEAVQRIRYADNETNYCARCQTGGKLLADRSLSRLLKGDWPKTLDELEMMKGKVLVLVVMLGLALGAWGQGGGRYRNPVLFADYSDPDVLRVGEDFYLVASSFDQVPGLPILHSRDLVNWELVGHALAVQPPVEVYSKTAHGDGVWAPALREHGGKFFIYYPDPEYGIYVVTAPAMTGPWSAPKLIKAAKGWIDPCPFWDEDGKAWLINGMAASRSGIKNELILSRMSSDGERLLDEGTLIIDGHGTDTTLEGPKLYKRHGYYYVFAPAGGVSTGYQLVYRARSITGPYERRKVLAQDKTDVNGPHQGAWVTTAAGEDWFLHFQDRGAFGRVTWLEPMRWEDDWPVIGVNQDVAGVGEPVMEYRKPKTGAGVVMAAPVDTGLGLEWQWQANPQPGWALAAPNLHALRLLAVPVDAAVGEGLWSAPNVMSVKFPGPAFTATVTLEPHGLREGDRAGMVVLGRDYAYVAVRQTAGGAVLVFGTCKDADKGGKEVETTIGAVGDKPVVMRLRLDAAAEGQFSVSENGVDFREVGMGFQARAGVWIGAKVGLFAQSRKAGGELGYVDVRGFVFAKE